MILVWIGEFWNFFEASIAIWAGLIAGSVALLAFGLDSIIELFAGAVLIWRFWKEKDVKEGKIIFADKINGIIVKTLDSLLNIELLQLSGKKILEWQTFLNGYKKSLSGTVFNRE